MEHIYLPFTHEQACDVAEDFSDMEGTGLIIATEDGEVACHIQHVAITPFATADKEQFMAIYTTEGNTEEALKSYAGDEYDVVILAVNAEDANIIALPVRVYTSTYGVPYRYP